MKLKGKIIDLTLDYITHKPRLTLQLSKQYDTLTEEFNELDKLDVIDIELKKEVKKRGLQANKYFHTLINEYAEYQRSKGIVISDEEMKIKINLLYGTIAKDSKNNVVGAKVPKGTDMASFYPYSKWYKDDGKCDCYLFYKRTSELDTREFTYLIRGLEAECKDVGIETLEDREFNKMMANYEKSLKRG